MKLFKKLHHLANKENVISKSKNLRTKILHLEAI